MITFDCERHGIRRSRLVEVEHQVAESADGVRDVGVAVVSAETGGYGWLAVIRSGCCLEGGEVGVGLVDRVRVLLTFGVFGQRP